MNKIKVIALALFGLAVCALHAAEDPIQPIGYFVETVSTPDGEQTKSHAKFVRDGEEFEAEPGMPVFPGDIVTTPASGGILVAFIDNNTLQLQGDTTATMHGLAGLSTTSASQFTVNLGHAYATARTVGDNGFNLDVGDSKAPLAKAKAPVPATLEIVVTRNPDGSYVSNIACLKGTATITPSGGAPVYISSLGFALLTLNTATNPPSGNVSAGNIDKKTLAGLKANNWSDTTVRMGKSTITFTSTMKNADGSITKGNLTTNMNGQVTKDTWKTTGANGLRESWTETPGTGRISMSQTFNGVTFTATFPGGKATIRDTLNKQTYTGTAIYDPKTGIVTFQTTKGGKDGSTATYTYNPGTPAGATMTVVIFGGPAPGTIQRVVANGAPTATTPDGRVIEQNSPPLSQ